ncbi:MAG: sigma-70 family RNA polymerase sigma factor [Asticcacaulis sp.]
MSRQFALQLYETHRASLISYASRLLGERSRAEDVVQDAWIDFQRASDRAEIQNPAAYLQRIVRNHAINLLRRDQRQARLIDDGAEAASIADPLPSAEASAIARERLEHFVSRLSQLPERQRLAIRLHRLEGMKMREIAERLNVSVPYVHSLISDGLIWCAHTDETE